MVIGRRARFHEEIYFWEYGLDRAMRFANFQKVRGLVKEPAVVGALIQLGNCFDLMDTRHTEALAKVYPMVVKASRGKAKLPVNRGDTPDKKLRRRDCAVLKSHSNRSSQPGLHPRGLPTHDWKRMSKSAAKKGPAAKTVDPVVRMHQAAIAKLRNMSSKQLFNVAVSAGIYTQDGKLTPPYRERGAARRGSKG